MPPEVDAATCSWGDIGLAEAGEGTIDRSWTFAAAGRALELSTGAEPCEGRDGPSVAEAMPDVPSISAVNAVAIPRRPI